MAAPSPPASGQLVTVRTRRFVVTDVAKSATGLSPLQPGSVPPAPQHLVTLSSVEDDALGEELRVVWEIEPGVDVIEDSALPDVIAFDDPLRLDAFLDAVRWGAISQGDRGVLQAPFRSGIEIEDYQLDPVVRALEMPRVNLLVADDVGLGKTIEAGLVAQELILRHRARRVLVVCPAGLQIQWRDQMREKFGLEFRIVDTALLRDLRRRRGLRVNPWTHFPRLITSIDFVKRDRPLRLFSEILPGPGEATYPRRFDLMILDEAHNVAPSGRGAFAVDSQRTAAIRTLAPHFEHKLFLSATPHNGYPESFSALLELLDNQRFARTETINRTQLGAVMVRRLKSDPALATKWDGTPRFAKRLLEHLEVEYPADERRAHAALREYTELRLKSPSSDGEKFASEFVLKLLKKRLFSSPAAFLATLEAHERSVLRGRGASAGPVLHTLRRQVDELEERFDDDEEYEETSRDLVQTSSRLFREPSGDERKLLTELKQFAQRASARRDAKAEKLLAWVKGIVRPGGLWSRDRVIVFTEYRATQKWLQGLLAIEGLTQGERLMVLHGGMQPEDREAIKAAFQADPDVSPVRILLATDAASEGIDLQRHCSRLVHYEIPWNPNRMEQRNGRVDRHGQRAAEVRIFHFVGSGFREEADATRPPGDLEGDLEFLMRAAKKVNQIREDLGKVGPVIAEQVEEAMLGRRKRLDTADAETKARPIREQLKFERDVAERVAELRARLDDTKRELRVDPENIRAVVEIGLELAGQPPLRPATLAEVWPDPTGSRKTCPVFHMPALRGSWAACASGVQHPHTHKTRPITFDHGVAQGRDDIVLVHLNHRLVQMCLRLLRAEMWARESTKKIHRVTARVVPNLALDAPAVVAYGRIVVLGGDNQRLHEEVIVAGGRIKEGRFSRMNVGEVQRATDAALAQRVAPDVEKKFIALWPALRDPLIASLDARMDDRTKTLDKKLQERAAKESGDIRAILTELAETIRREMSVQVPAQLEFWTPPEREQRERNRAGLADRLARIPAEIEQETAAVLRRYAKPTPRLFPAAVAFLVPEKFSR